MTKHGIPREDWEELWRTSALRGKFQAQGTASGYDETMVERKLYHWDLGFDGEIRYCSACGQDLAKGECSIQPMVIDEVSKRAYMNIYTPDLTQMYHVRCVHPIQWESWLATPAPGKPKKVVIKRNDTTFQRAIDDGWLTLDKGVSVPQAVDRVRLDMGLSKARR